jgi:hypothetical protein
MDEIIRVVESAKLQKGEGEGVGVVKRSPHLLPVVWSSLCRCITDNPRFD